MYTLYIGNKNYSSWSLRGWLAARLSGAPFREVKIQLQGTYNPDNRSFSPTALVPALHDGDVQVWDSLAISEYLAERHPGMWPANPLRAPGRARSRARCIRASARCATRWRCAYASASMCGRGRTRSRPTSRASRRSGPTRAAASAGPGPISWANSRWPMSSMRRWRSASRPTTCSRPAPRASTCMRCSRIRSCANGKPTALAEREIIEADEPRILYRDKIEQ